MAEEHGASDTEMTVDYGCPFYITRDPFPPSEQGLPQRAVNPATVDKMPPGVQALYERREQIRGRPETATYVRVKMPTRRWVKDDNGWHLTPI